MFKKLFHKISYRIYIIGKNIDFENISRTRPAGISQISKIDKLFLGTNVTFGGEVLILGSGQIHIGDETMIAGGVIIHTSTHDYQNHPMNIQRIDKNVNIGKHVWVGTGAIILPGITIGDFSVVGAGSVVTKDVLAGTIVGGVPSVLIKKRPDVIIN